MKLTTVDKVMDRMNISGVATSKLGTMESVVEGATPYLESLLRTKLSAASVTDSFTYIRGRYAVFSPIACWLSQGFLTDAPTVYVTKTSGTPLLDINDGVVLVEGTDYIVNREIGQVTFIRDFVQGHSCVAVTYEAGFVDETDEALPPWLVEAAIAAAVYLRHQHALTHNKNEKDISGSLGKIVYSQVNEHIRTPYGGLYPISSVSEAL